MTHVGDNYLTHEAVVIGQSGPQIEDSRMPGCGAPEFFSRCGASGLYNVIGPESKSA
jgi:hypothetical protein